MTKEITKAFIIQEIQDKFRLRELVPEKFTFSEMVVPTYDIRPHTQKWIIEKVVISITETGGVLYYTVPDTEEWHLRSYTPIFYSGVFTIAGIYITRVYDPTYFMYLDLKAAQDTSYTVNLPMDVRLQAGDTININIDGYTTTGWLQLYVDIMKEEIR